MCFYPQCGFLALGTASRHHLHANRVEVSIRNADFWLWEPWHYLCRPYRRDRRFYPQCGFLALGTALAASEACSMDGFLSAMRIFGFGNSADPVRRVAHGWFLSAMRIFGFGNLRRRRPPPRSAVGFYPQCGFLALGTRAYSVSLPFNWIVSIRNADFWLWEHVSRGRSANTAS